MSQTVIEAGIITTIRKHADFDDTNCNLYDRRPMAKGLARVVVVSYDSVTSEQITIQMERRTWVYNVDVMVPWRGDLVELDTRVAVETQKVIDTLAAYPRLSATANVQRADLSAAARPDLIMERKGVYRGRRHTLNVLEIVNPGRTE
jgi:hypothetical protein